MIFQSSSVSLRVALQDPVGEDELADVVQQPGGVDQLLLLLREAGRDRDLPRVARDRGGVARGHPVPQVERAQQRAQHPDLDRAGACGRSCLPRRSSSSARCSESSSWPSRYWKVNSTIPNSAIAARPIAVVEVGDADRQQRRGELRGKHRDQRASRTLARNERALHVARCRPAIIRKLSASASTKTPKTSR